jgi:hypothetical protein
MGHVAAGPPALPDGGLSPGRCCPWPPGGGLPSACAASALPHRPPCTLWGAATGAPGFTGPTRSGSSWSSPGPRAPGHEPGVPALAVRSWTPSAGLTPPSSLLRAPAPVLPPPRALVGPADPRSVQGAGSPCGEEDLPDVGSAPPARRAWTSPPAAPAGPRPVAALRPSAFPPFGPGRRSPMPLQRLQHGALCEAAVMPAWAGPQVCSPPRALLPLRLTPHGSRGGYGRAARGVFPPHAPDRLTVRIGPLTV